MAISRYEILPAMGFSQDQATILSDFFVKNYLLQVNYMTEIATNK